MNTETLSNNTLTLQDYWTIVKRRKWWLTIPLVMAIPIGIGIGLLLPKVYSASTVILIDPPKVPKEYILEPERENNIDVRLETLKREILSGNHIEQIVKEINLYRQGEDKSPSPEEVMAGLRWSVSLETLKTDIKAGKQRSLDAFILTYEGQDPETVMQVTNRLAELFVEENKRRQGQFVENTSAFLETELANLRVKLEQQEEGLIQFKNKYMVEMPEQIGANLRSLEQYQLNLATISDELTKAEEKKALIENGSLEIFSSESTNGSLEARLAEQQNKLLELQAVFKDNYPDVITTKHEINYIESLLAQKSLNSEAASLPDSEDPVENPAHAKLQQELYKADVNINALKDRQTELNRLISLYQSRIDRSPVREQELLSLMRDQEKTRERYQALLNEKIKVEISGNIERQTEGEQFRILESATLPEKPLRPDMFRIMLIAIASGMAVSIGLVSIVEYNDASFHKTDEVEKITGLKVLCAIPRYSKSLANGPTNGFRRKLPPSIFVNDSHSVAAEQYRFLSGRIQQYFGGSTSKVLAITSSVVGEGKSTTSLNVAIALATDFRKRTVLIDTDFGRPGEEWLSNEKGMGLVEVLKGEISLESVLVRLPSYNITILPKGDLSKINPMEILGTPKLSEAIGQLKQQFDYVLMDCPPVLQLASTNLVTEVSDAVVMVVKADETPRTLVLKAAEAIGDYKKVMGIVFNNVNQSEIPKKYYYSYSYTHV
jgi:polysaccharide biosynthesis transport protein